MPADCSTDASPFVQGECLQALREACNARASAEECGAAEPVTFADGGFEVVCGWAEVASFASADACDLRGTSERCEASLGCGDGPDGDVKAFPAAVELVRLCGGPLGPWSEVGAPGGETEACDPNAASPQHPLCGCADVVGW